MAKPLPKTREPQPLTQRSVPESLGSGRVCLYDSRAGLPDLLETPSLAALKAAAWVLVHFPSRRHALVKTKDKGLSIIKRIKDGVDEVGILAAAPANSAIKKGNRTRVHTHTRTKPEPAPTKAKKKPAAPVPAPAKAEEPQTPQEPEKPAQNDDGPTPVPAGMTFDQAMQHVFPPGRITGELERLLRAKRTIVSRDGDELGSEEVHMVQINTLTRIISYHQGLPPPKEKPPAEKPKVTYEELERMIMTSEAAQEMMQRLLDKARADKAAAAGDVTNPLPAES